MEPPHPHANLTPEERSRIRLADTLREAARRTANSPLAPETLARANAIAADLVAALEPGLSAAGAAAHVRHTLRSPAYGLANVVAPPLEMWVEGGQVHGRVTFSQLYEGGPGRAHGGAIALVFDELLGRGTNMLGSIALTATLAITYRSPTALYVPLRLIGWADPRDGRKVVLHGQLFDGETLCAEAHGLFIAPRDPLPPGGGS